MSDYRSTAIKPEEVDQLPLSEMFKDFPKKLKNPKMYDKVRKEMFRIMYSDHKHTRVKAFVKCKRCSVKIRKRKEYLAKVGFKDYRQYLEWSKIMVIIKDKELK